MSDELAMDTTKEIFKLDKDILDFIINPLSMKNISSLPSGNKAPLSEVNITIKNITNEYIVIRVRTTKKQKFSVVPNHLMIKPNSEEKVSITYYHKSGHKLHSDECKFKFEGFIIPENQKNLEVKDIFKEYVQKKIKVIGNIIKINTKFTEEFKINNSLDVIKEDEKEILRESNNSLLNSQQSDMSILSRYSVPESIKGEDDDKNNMVKLSDLIINNNKNEELNDKKKLENLKREYNQLKEELDKLKKNEELLNKKIKYEKNRKNIIPESEKFRFNVPVIKEKPFSRNILLGIFAFSAIIGFYLVK